MASATGSTGSMVSASSSISSLPGRSSETSQTGNKSKNGSSASSAPQQPPPNPASRSMLRTALQPYYISNYILASAFIILKVTPGICDFLFEDCQIQMREYEVFTFLMCIVAVKFRKQAHLLNYMGTLCTFLKVCNCVLFFRQSVLYCFIYAAACLLHLVFIHEPIYRGPQKIIYFRPDELKAELAADTRVVWVVALYAPWSPACHTFAPLFAELSYDYTLSNLRFGKVDVYRFPEMAREYRIDTSSFSRQLPTVVLFKGGRETDRRPNENNRFNKYFFTRDNLVNDLGLNQLYTEQKKLEGSRAAAPAATPADAKNVGSSKAAESTTSDASSARPATNDAGAEPRGEGTEPAANEGEGVRRRRGFLARLGFS